MGISAFVGGWSVVRAALGTTANELTANVRSLGQTWQTGGLWPSPWVWLSLGTPQMARHAKIEQGRALLGGPGLKMKPRV